jgi:hypothetical protein
MLEHNATNFVTKDTGRQLIPGCKFNKSHTPFNHRKVLLADSPRLRTGGEAGTDYESSFSPRMIDQQLFSSGFNKRRSVL